MILFSKKFPVLFISKQFIDPGQVIIGKTVTFDGFEALPYTGDTLVDVLKQIQPVFKKNIRVVLSEELVYVTGLSFPTGTHFTRDLVRHALAETIPEDLLATEWDFQTLHYAKKQETETEVFVQAAVIEGKFFRLLAQALETVSLSIESIIPESYALAQLATDYDSVSLLVVRNREGALLVATEKGLVIATRIERGEITQIHIERFLSFLTLQKARKVVRVIFSRFSEEEVAFFQKLTENGYELIREEYNPLVGAALQVQIGGKDDEVLNLNTFLLERKTPWWQAW